MVRFEPFAGIRYDCARLGDDVTPVTAPPYDVIEEPERAALEAHHPHNSVRLVLPRDGRRAGDRYTRAAATFREWRAEGVLVADPSPRFYGYRMDHCAADGRARHTVGVIGALHLPQRVGGNGILPHERTLAKARSDRLDLLRATRANVDPIWGLTLTPGFSGLVDDSQLLCSCRDADGVEHRLFGIDAPDRVAAVTAAAAGSPLVLADGHHRFETACAYRDERGASDRGAAAIMALVVELSDDELDIEAIHRLATLPSGFEPREALADAFTVTPVDEGAAPDAMVLVDRDGRARLDPRPAVVERLLAGEHPSVASTDAALVEHVVAPRWPGAEWVYRHDAHEVAALVDKGAFGVGLVLRAPSVATTRAAALAGARMPQKTTFFCPKPRTGMVFRSLDDPALDARSARQSGQAAAPSGAPRPAR